MLEEFFVEHHQVVSERALGELSWGYFFECWGEADTHVFKHGASYAVL